MMDPKIRTESIEKITREVDPDPEIRDLREQVKIRDQKINEYKKEFGAVKSFFRDIKDHITPIPPALSEYKPPKKEARVSSPITAVMLSTDGHMGKIQEADEIEGFNEFGPDLCIKRQMFFSESVIKWVDLHRSAYRCDDLAHLVTGDLISGDIHHELMVNNAFPTPVQVVKAGELLAKQIACEAPHFAKVTVHFITEDNHSRLSKKLQFAQAGFNSLNYVIGFIAKERLRDHKNVEFNIYPMLQKVVTVQGRRYLLTHGHKTPYNALGLPWYGISRKAMQEAIRRMKEKKHGFDLMVQGHYHMPLSHPWFWVGGSVSGSDAVDHGFGRYAEPSQAAWLVHPKHGEFNRTDFRLIGADKNVQ